MKSFMFILIFLLGVGMLCLVAYVSQELRVEESPKPMDSLEMRKHKSFNPIAPLNTDPSVLEATQTILSGFMGFGDFNESFTSNVKLTDVSTNEVYDLSSNYELYYEDNKIKIGKYDDTDYEGVLKNVKLKHKQLEEEKMVQCTDKIKCIADFNTNIGEKLCCGQKGRLKDTRYVCPENKPTCGNFKCGTNFGECS